jgi:hypothetical protein
MTELRTELTLPGDLAVIPLARGYARGMARLAHLPDEDVDALELAAQDLSSLPHAARLCRVLPRAAIR